MTSSLIARVQLFSRNSPTWISVCPSPSRLLRYLTSNPCSSRTFWLMVEPSLAFHQTQLNSDLVTTDLVLTLAASYSPGILVTTD